METKKKWTARILAGILIVCMMLTTMPALPEGGTVEVAGTIPGIFEKRQQPRP